MPKLPPPPLRPQKRSAFSLAFAVKRRPSAVTTSAETRLSTVRPCLLESQPRPPPKVRPAMPVSDTVPPLVARPKACVSWSKSIHLTPGSARARRAAGSTRMPFIVERSMSSPPSQTLWPGMLWPPPQTAEAVRHMPEIMHEIARDLGRVADAVAAQGQRVGHAAKARLDRADDLVVAADRGEEVRDIVRHLLCHLAPFALARHRVELVAEVFEPLHPEDREIGRGRAV